MGTLNRTLGLPVWVKVLLAVVALANIYRVSDRPLDANRAVDFRNVYVGQLLLTEGENPYDDALLKSRWKQVTVEEGIEWVSEPGFPHNPLVYPPWALALFSPFSLLSFSTAYVIWYLLIPVLLVGFIWGIVFFITPNSVGPVTPNTVGPVAPNSVGPVAPNSDSANDGVLKTEDLRSGVRSYRGTTLRSGVRSYRKTTLRSGVRSYLLDFLLLALAFKGTIHAFIVCQPTFLCFAAIGGFCWAYLHEKKVLTGLFLAVAAFKVSLVIPFVLWMAFKKEWKILLWSMGIGAVFWAVAILFSHDPVVMHAAWLETMGQLNGLVFDPNQEGYPIYFTMTQITELGTLMEYFVEGGSQWRGWVYLGIWLALIPFLLYRITKGRMDDISMLVLLIFALFLTTYHQFYDLLLLLLVYPFALSFSFRSKALLFLILMPLFLPVNGILTLLGPPEVLWFLYFTTPLVVLFITAWGLKNVTRL